MKKRIFAALMTGAVLFSSVVPVMAAEEEKSDLKGEIYVFIAASLSNAMEEIQKDFNETYPDVEILYNADSSGYLQTQIEEGARCDVFFSAAEKQMNALVEEKLVPEDSVADLLENKVVLIKPAGQDTKVTGFENITDAANLALAGDSVPVGQYAREIFENLGNCRRCGKNGDQRREKCDRGACQCKRRHNEVGVVYATDAASVGDKVEVIAEAPEGSLETPVLYPAGLVENKEATEEDKAAAEEFLKYLQSEEALKVFEEYGFAAYKGAE